tara:strand:- start:30515 stop:30829 length:315 start_codon:yes stop_codon:yes gene_type:complete
MSKLETEGKLRKNSTSGRRFFTSRDMAIVKHDDAVRNSKAKRGEITLEAVREIFPCGCGAEGCFLHFTRKSKPIKRDVKDKKNVHQLSQEDSIRYDNWLKERTR